MQAIVNRWMPGILRNIGGRHGVMIDSFSDDWVLRLRKDDMVRFVIGYKFGLNDSAAASVAQDKVATSLLLADNAIDAVGHVLVRTKAADAMSWTMPDGQKFVLKPLVGTSGHGVRLFMDSLEAERYMLASGIEAWAVSPSVEIIREVRLVLLDGNCLLSYEKKAAQVDGLRMFNLGKGATPETTEPSQEMIDIAGRTCRALNLRLCAVDIIECNDGSLKVMEVNDGMMMERYMRHSESNRKIAEDAYEKIVLAMMNSTIEK